jgi:undecaprenyl-diphosphatase
VQAPVDVRLACASVACGGVFALLTVLVWTGWAPLVSFDRRWSTRAYEFMLDHEWCETISRMATWTANGLTIAILTALVVLICLLLRHPRLGWWVAITVAGSSILNSLVKNAVDLTRPSTANVETPAHGFSFPSGHTQAATVTYVAVVLVVCWEIWCPARWLRRVSVVAVVLLVAGVGLSRVLLGAHWTSDVLGGWLLGSAWVITATVLLIRWRPRHVRATAERE